jgi:two-component system, LytTR family, sensor kinase
MEAFFLVGKLLEKVAVLVAAVLLLTLVRPASVWLREAGGKASLRRRATITVLLGAVAVWGAFLGMSVGGTRFNIRLVGVVVSGYLGGPWVGLIVGTAAGLVAGLGLGKAMMPYVLAVSMLVGVLAGVWSKRFGAGFRSVAMGALVIQLIYHVVIGAVMFIVDPSLASEQVSNVNLHAAKITANLVGIALFMGVLNLSMELDQARASAQESMDLARSARLEALQYQLKPHFLFNILNTLGYLIRTDASRARHLTVELADFLRYTLANEKQMTSLADELEQVRRYVELERARFGDELSFEVESTATELFTSVMVPPLILQPLVENAIRHGSREGVAAVQIVIEAEQESLRVQILDRGYGPARSAKTATSTGLGLENVRERLQRFYRSPILVEIAARTDGPGTVVEFRLPQRGTNVGAGSSKDVIRKVLS